MTGPGDPGGRGGTVGKRGDEGHVPDRGGAGAPERPDGGEDGGRAPVPDQIVGAAQAWLATAVLQVAAAFTTLAINLLNPGAIVSAPGADGILGDYSPDERIMIARTSAVLIAVLTLAACGLFAFFVTRMRRGALWARLILVAGSVYLAVQMLPLYIGAAGPWAEAPVGLKLADGALTIASAMAAIAGTVLASGPRAMEYFTGTSGPKGPGGDNGGPGTDNGGSGRDRR